MLQSKISIVVLFFAVLSVPLRAYAQTQPTVEAAIEAMSLDGKASNKAPVPKSSVLPVNLQVHWRLWKKVRVSGQPGVDELTALEHDGRSIGFTNQPEYSLATTAAALAEPDLANAKALFERAQSLGPHLPYPFLAEVSHVALKEPSEFSSWGNKFITGIENGLMWPDSVIPWLLKVFLFALFSLTVASLVFTFGQLLRNLPIVAYDATRIMPRGFSSNQTAIILMAVIVVPGVIWRSPLVSVLVMLALVSLVQNWRERLVAVTIFVGLAMLPKANDIVYHLASYFGSQTQVSARAQYIGCDTACRTALAQRVAEDETNQTLRYTDLLAAFRTGERSELIRVTKEAAELDDPAVVGYARNLAGAAWVALAKPKKAVESLLESSAALPHSPAPNFNLMRAYQMQDQTDNASNALGLAFDADLQRVTQYLSYERRDVNSFLMVEPLPLKALLIHHFASDTDASSAVGSAWRGIAGSSIGLEQAPIVGGIGILLMLLGLPLRRKKKTSTPCPRCGMARDPNDSKETSNHHYCLSCYRTFVTGSVMNYEARVHNERVLGRRESTQMIGRRALSILVPGAGYHLAGRAISGFTLTAVFVFAALNIVRPFGVARPPFALLTDNWAFQTSVSWIVLSVCITISLLAALRDIAPVQET